MENGVWRAVIPLACLMGCTKLLHDQKLLLDVLAGRSTSQSRLLRILPLS